MWLILVRCDPETAVNISGADIDADFTRAQVAEALGLAVGDIVDFEFSSKSGADAVSDLPGVAVNPAGGGVFLSTGRAGDAGTGSTDFLTDEKADATGFSITLSVPGGMQSLVYSPLFRTAEYGGSNPKADRAEVRFSTSTGALTLAEVEDTPAAYPVEIRAVDVSSASTITAQFVIEDATNGLRDSGLLLRRFLFTEAKIVTGDAVERSLSLPDDSLVAARVEATSGTVRIIDILSAKSGNSGGSLLLSTGFSNDRASGDTDLAGDGIPDATLLHLTLSVPQDGDTKSLVFSSQFVTSEFGVGGSDSATVESTKDSSASTIQDIGDVGSSSSAEDPPVTRAVDVEGAQEVHVVFKVTDNADRGKRDSGLLISGLYFSEFEASLLANPRPSDAKLNTGTYAYQKTLLAASGSMLPFGFMTHYNSAPRRTSGRMGPRWGHSYDWSVIELENGDRLVRRGDGAIETFEKRDGTDAYEASHGRIFNILSKDGDEYVYLTKQQTRYRFDADGKLVSITDPNGNATLLSYLDDLLDSVADTRNRTASFEHNENKLLTGVTYASHSIEFAYDSDDNLISFQDPDGNTTQFTYNDAHDLLTGIDGNGDVFVTNTYDDLHRVTEQIDAKGDSRRNIYATPFMTNVDRVGNEQRAKFDPLDRRVSTRDGTGAETLFGYDDNDNVTSITDPLNAVGMSRFDERGNAIERIDPLGDIARTTFDERNRPVEAINELEQRITFVHDANGNLLRDTNALGLSNTYEYDSRGLATGFTDRIGNVYRYTHTAAGDVAEMIDPLGGLERFEYDDLGRTVASYDVNGHGTFITLNGSGRVTSITDALGGLQTRSYDAAGRVVREVNPLGDATRFEYTPTGQFAGITDPTGAVATAEFDDEDRPLAVTDALGNTTRFTYDKAGRLETATDALAGVARSEYDAAGQRIGIIDPNGNATRFTYDASGSLVAQTDALGNSVSNTYDASGRVISITNGRGQTIAIEYDAATRLTTLRFPDRVVTYELDANGNRLETIGRHGRRSSRKYDALNRLVRFTDVNGNTIRYRYDPVGNLLAIKYSDGAMVRYTYDELNRMTSVTDWNGRKTRYEFNANNYLVAAHLPDGSQVAYEYDAAGRLISVDDTTRKGATTYRARYTLNANGQIVAEEAELPLEAPVTTEWRNFEFNAANQITAENGTQFSYDADGNMLHGVVGRIPMHLSYDESGRLLEAGASRYEYDEDSVRIEATINGKSTHYVHDPNGGYPRVLEEHDRHGRITARYVHGLGLISRHSGSHHKEQVAVYHYDSRGSTVALSDLKGRVTDRYAYDPYGLVVARDGHTPNPYTYNGRDGVVDDGNGLYFMQARYYEPRLMRFISRDDVVLGSAANPQSLNRYAFVLGDPLNRIDPDGELAFLAVLAIGAIVGAVGGVGVQAVSDAISGESSSWEDYVGAAVEGAFIGAAVATGGGGWTLFAAGVAGSAAGNASTQGLRIASGKSSSFDEEGFGIDVAFGAAFSAGAAGLGKVGTKLIPRLAGKSLRVTGRAATRARMLARIGTGSATKYVRAHQKNVAKKATLEILEELGESLFTDDQQGMLVRNTLQGTASVITTLTAPQLITYYGPATAAQP